tara:strand:- start:1291 stop:2241 length:951 start_codon:yes stop_codon:yes gene_type:complete
MAQALGLSWENDRTEVIQGLNDYRNDLYNFYSELKLFNDVFHCICIQTLPMQCTGACSEGQTFQGFALPSDVQAIETAWESNQPLKIRSRWRESHTGRGQGATSRIEIIELPEQVPTERPLKAISKLQVFGEHADDEGKGVAIEIVDIYGKRKVVLIPIRSQVWSKGMDSVKQILSVRLPQELQGAVSLADENGYILSEYDPSETVPLYRRFRIANNCPSGHVLIQGVKRFRPIFFDHDIVEVGDRRVIHYAGSYLRYSDNTTDVKELKRSEYDLSKMQAQMVGLLARSQGNAVQDNSPIKPRAISTTGDLPGYSR